MTLIAIYKLELRNARSLSTHLGIARALRTRKRSYVWSAHWKASPRPSLSDSHLHFRITNHGADHALRCCREMISIPRQFHREACRLALWGTRTGRGSRGENRIASSEPMPNPAIRKVTAVEKSYCGRDSILPAPSEFYRASPLHHEIPGVQDVRRAATQILRTPE
jgi:hypothetical protein